MTGQIDPDEVLGPPPFDPTKHLMQLPKRAKNANGDWVTVQQDYLEVKFRIQWLRDRHPDANIETELIFHDPDRGLAVCKAKVSVPPAITEDGSITMGGGSATGLGSETSGDFGDYLEKAETKALGRALAALGFGTQFCVDFDFEHESAKQPARVVDAPVSRNAGPGAEPVQFPANRSSAPAQANQGGAMPQGQALTRPATAQPQRQVPQGESVPPATEPQIKTIYAIAGGKGMDRDEADAACIKKFGGAPHLLTRRQASEMIDFLKAG